MSLTHTSVTDISMLIIANVSIGSTIIIIIILSIVTIHHSFTITLQYIIFFLAFQQVAKDRRLLPTLISIMYH